MKRLQLKGAGSQKKQAEILTEDEEEMIWSKGFLGVSSPQSLLDTMVFYNGLYFALRSGKEHRQLRSHPCQITLIEHPGEKAYLKYVEDISKNRQGGIKGRNIKPKEVIHHANTQRCFVRLFKLYQQLVPENKPAHAFYLQPLKKHGFQTNHWDTRHLAQLLFVSVNLLEFPDLTFFESHSSDKSGVDEQLVMERTGHRSLDGVRNYKRTSNAQCEELSDTLNCKRPCLDLQSSAKMQVAAPIPGVYLSSCSSVTINIHHNNPKSRSLLG